MSRNHTTAVMSRLHRRFFIAAASLLAAVLILHWHQFFTFVRSTQIVLPAQPLLAIPTLFGYGILTFAIVLVPAFVFFLLSIRSRLLSILVAFVVSIYYAIEALLTYFQVTRNQRFDFFYFWLNRDVIYSTLANIYDGIEIWLTLFFIIILLFWTGLVMVNQHMVPALSNIRTWRRVLIALVALAAFFSFTSPVYWMIKDAQTTFNVLRLSPYNDLYLNSLRTLPPDSQQDTALDHSIVMLHLESVNSEYVNPEVTPVLYDHASEGTLLKQHYSNAVQTHRVEEVILCASLPSLYISFDNVAYKNIIDVSRESNIPLVCLPQLLKQAGYKTLFFKSHSLEFQRAGEFALGIGFDEAFDASDISKEGDPMLAWGAREDVFYHRVVEFLDEHYHDEKFFAYIAVSSTNHHNWIVTEEETPADIYERLPRSGTDIYSRRQNTLFVQDAYVQEFFDAYEETFTRNSTDIFIFGDHPVGIYRERPEYSYNVEGVENKHFLTALMFIPSHDHAEKFQQNQVIEQNVGSSHIDIAPTVLDLLSLDNPYVHGESLLSLLISGSPSQQRCVTNVQPYFGVSIALVEQPHKIVINLFDNTIEYADLRQGEDRMIVHQSTQDAKAYLEACFDNDLASLVKFDERSFSIAHGLGSISGIPITNSREAFIYNYEDGFRWFEVDLRLTRDDKLIAWHDADFDEGDDRTITIKNTLGDALLQKRSFGSYTPLDFDALLLLLNEYPDTTLVLDTKDDFETSYQAMRSSLDNFADRYGTATRDRVINQVVPQVYEGSQIGYLNSYFTFPRLIFTLYQSNYSDSAVVDIVTKTPVFMVTMSTARFSERLVRKLEDLGIQVGVHTVNDSSFARYLYNHGANMIYTDDLGPM